MKTINLGIIGLGYIGMLHLNHSLKLPNAKVTAVADTQTKALETARALGVKKTFADYTELLKDPQVDAVIISLPTHLHLRCTQLAAEAKKQIFLEKPIALTVEQAKDVISTAERYSVKLMVGYPLRFKKDFIKIKQEIENGMLGDVQNTHATYIGSGPFFHRADGHSPVPVPDWWFNTTYTGGGVLVDLGVHMINLLRMFFGEIDQIQGHFGYRFNMDFEDSALCLAKFSSGTLAVINVGWYSQDYILKFDFLGTMKHASVSHMPPKTLPRAYQMLTKGISSFTQPHFDELQYFVNCVIEDKAPSPSGEDGLRDLEAISKAYKNQLAYS